MADPRPWLRALRRVAVVIVLAVLFIWTANGAKGPRRCDRVASMGALEMAGSATAASNIRAEWQGMSGLTPSQFTDALRRALLWDFGFIVFYTLALILACRAVAKAAQGWPWKRTAAIARGAALLAVAPALLDVIEDIALWKGLSQTASNAWPRIARLCAIPKFAILGAIVLFVLVTTAFLVARRAREDADTWPLALLWM